MILSLSLMTLTACGEDEGSSNGTSNGTSSGTGGTGGTGGDDEGDGDDTGNVPDEDPPTPPCEHRDQNDDLRCDGCGEEFDDLEDLPVAGLSYRVCDDGASCTIKSIGRAIKNRRFIIPEEIDGYKVVGIEANAFRYCTEIVELVIPEGVLTIGDFAFYSCRNLRRVIISDTVEYIGESAFEYCRAVKYVKIGDGVKTISDRAFYGCMELIWIDMGKSVTSFGEYAFGSCVQLLSITLPEPLASIGSDAFNYCAKLYEMVDNSPTFAAITGSNATTGLNIIGAHEGETNFVREGDFIFYIAEDKNYLCGYVGDASEITLPESYLGAEYTIADRAFARNSVIERVYINSSELIGVQAFEACPNLRFVEIGDKVKTVGAGAFADCTNLRFVEIGRGVESLEINAFSSCKELFEVVDNSAAGVASAEDDKSGLTRLTPEIHSGESRMKTIGKCVFYTTADGEALLIDYLGSDRSVSLPTDYEGKPYNIGSRAFAANKTMVTITFPECVEVIYSEAFSEATSLAYVKFHDGITTIGKNAFYCCYHLMRVDVGEGMALIEDDAFTGCTQLIEVNNSSKTITVTSSKTLNGGIGRYAREYNRFYNSTIWEDGDFIFYMPDGNKTPYVIGYVGESNVIKLPTLDPKGSNLICYYSNAFSFNDNLDAVVIENMPYLLGAKTFFRSSNMNKVFLLGSESKKQDLINKCGYENPQLKGAVIYLYSETEPTVEGNYWYYDEEGNIVYW